MLISGKWQNMQDEVNFDTSGKGTIMDYLHLSGKAHPLHSCSLIPSVIVNAM